MGKYRPRHRAMILKSDIAQPIKVLDMAINEIGDHINEVIHPAIEQLQNRFNDLDESLEKVECEARNSSCRTSDSGTQVNVTNYFHKEAMIDLGFDENDCDNESVNSNTECDCDCSDELEEFKRKIDAGLTKILKASESNIANTEQALEQLKKHSEFANQSMPANAVTRLNQDQPTLKEFNELREKVNACSAIAYNLDTQQKQVHDIHAQAVASEFDAIKKRLDEMERRLHHNNQAKHAG